ncbi:MAG: YcfA-like protein [Methanoregulaceae archaeon PtaU1.Bin059]|nr:MAG: YcfA-like protein [Methanoregulaceae archaeon PtaB.Bin152]OPY43864.1 MAG: YcfA-like protein [Methanoregulaceae archaeon PtaU1.Bin059]
MSKLGPERLDQVIRKLRMLGFIGPIPGGKHQRMVNLSTRKIIPLPVHGRTEISVGLIREIIREAGISREEWLLL